MQSHVRARQLTRAKLITHTSPQGRFDLLALFPDALYPQRVAGYGAHDYLALARTFEHLGHIPDAQLAYAAAEAFEAEVLALV